MERQGKNAIRGTYVRFIGDPFEMGPEEALDCCTDGIIVFENGIITAIGPATEILASNIIDEETYIETYKDAIILPGFIDSHTHAAQMDVAATYGAQLLEWLNKYTFPAEMKLANHGYGAEIARLFLTECIKNGTTFPVAFATSYPNFTDSLFSLADDIGMRIITGSVFMNRNVPEKLAIDCQKNYDYSKQLINKWHNRGRAKYSVIDRFAITSTQEELELVSALYHEHPGTYFHTHLSENIDEVGFAKSLYPERADYLDIYDHYGLVDDRSIFAHCVHLTESEISRLAVAGSIISHSPSSNMFLGSGVMDLKKYVDSGLKVNLASDFAGGNKVSMLSAMNAAYKAAQLKGFSLHPACAYYMATAGAAKNLGMGNCVGNLQVGMEADFVLLDNLATTPIAWRTAQCNSISELLFVHMMLSDDRATRAVYIGGKRIFTDQSLQLV